MADAGRVIAGSAKGIRLAGVGPATRPLADRVKQALFAMLGPDLPGAHVLDLFAGSGAAGIEALSRGAERAVFVERDPGAVKVIEENLRRARLMGERALIVRADVTRWLGTTALAAGPFDLVFVDPPYADVAAATATLASLGRADAPLDEHAIVVVKHFWRDRPSASAGLLASERERRFGETAITIFRRGAAAGEPSRADTPQPAEEGG